MKVTVEKQPECQVLLTIEASDEEMAQAKEDAFKAMAPRVAVQGFRPGKAPRGLIERQIGKERLLTEALGDLLPRLYRQAVKENDIHPYDESAVDIVQRDPLVVKATIPVRPTVTLGDYRAVRIPKETVTVDDDEVDAVLKDLQEEHSEWVPVTGERGVHLGDQVVMDLLGVSGVKTFAERKELVGVVSEETGVIIPGLASEIVGMPAGVEKKIAMTLPETFSQEDLRGQPAEFAVTVREIKEKHTPALDDEFAKTVGDVADLAALRERGRQGLLENKEKQARERLEEQALKQVVEISQVEFPAGLLDEEVDSLVKRAGERIRQYGLDLDTYLKTVNKNRDEFRKEMEPQARARIKNALVLGQLGEAEQLEVQPAEVEAETERLILEAGEKAEQARKNLSTDRARRSIHELLLERKIMARLVDMVTA